MANEEQLSILKQGYAVWNMWRTRMPDVKIDLKMANISECDFGGANLSGAHLDRADLRGTNLRSADLTGASLNEADLAGAYLNKADLTGADLVRANFTEAVLLVAQISGAHLREANLRDANLVGTDISGAYLMKANLSNADLRGANLRGAVIEATVLSDIDLRTTLGLEKVEHLGPSTIGTDTLQLSQGKIPEVFLKGCGLSDWEIETAKLYNPDLSNEEINDIQYKIYDLRATRAIQISPLFISYSHSDSRFVKKIEGHLNKKGIRFWRDIHDMKSGPMEKQIDRAIRQNPTVLLVLSEHSLSSDWVEHEVRTARELEKEIGREVLCPVALDNSWKSSPWPKRVME